MNKIIYSLLFFLISNNSWCQQKMVMTHEDMWLMKRVGSPAISPDGKWVVFSVLDPSYDEKNQTNDIWIAPIDRSLEPRRLTAAKAAETSYTWSPDGNYLAFVAKRDGDEENQIYLLNMKYGGEAQRFTTLSSGASNPKWRNDSKALLFNSAVYPGCYQDSLQIKKAKEKKDLKYKARVYESFPIRDWDHWMDEKLTHLFVQHLDSTKATNLFFTVNIANESGFKYNGSAWTNNDEVVFSANIDANTAAHRYTSSHLYKLNINSGLVKQLTFDHNFSYANPIISDDGKFLFCTVNSTDYKVYELPKIVKYQYPSMSNPIELNTKLDRAVNSYVLNGNEVIASVESEGKDIIYKLTNDKATPVTNSTKGCFTNPSSAKGVIVATYESTTSPPEIVSISNNGEVNPITSFNSKKLSTLDLNEVETFWTNTSKGKKIRSMILKPANFDKNKQYPLFVLMHGGPAISSKENWGYRWNPHVLAGEEMVIIMTDYTGSTGYGEKFSQDIQFDPFKGPAEEINEAAAHAIKKYSFIDGKKQAAGGASYGGHLSNWMQATTTHYKCLVAHAGLVNSVSQWGTSDVIFGREVMNGGAPWTKSKTWMEQNPMLYAENFKTPMLLTVGELDYRVPINNTIESWYIHQRLQIPSKLIVFPEENHWILKAENSKFMYKEIRDWLLKWLK